MCCWHVSVCSPGWIMFNFYFMWKLLSRKFAWCCGGSHFGTGINEYYSRTRTVFHIKEHLLRPVEDEEDDQRSPAWERGWRSGSLAGEAKESTEDGLSDASDSEPWVCYMVCFFGWFLFIPAFLKVFLFGRALAKPWLCVFWCFVKWVLRSLRWNRTWWNPWNLWELLSSRISGAPWAPRGSSITAAWSPATSPWRMRRKAPAWMPTIIRGLRRPCLISPLRLQGFRVLDLDLLEVLTRRRF